MGHLYNVHPNVHLKAQGTLQKKGQKGGKGWKMENVAAGKCCFLDIALMSSLQLYEIWTGSSQKRATNIPVDNNNWTGLTGERNKEKGQGTWKTEGTVKGAWGSEGAFMLFLYQPIQYFLHYLPSFDCELIVCLFEKRSHYIALGWISIRRPNLSLELIEIHMF